MYMTSMLYSCVNGWAFLSEELSKSLQAPITRFCLLYVRVWFEAPMVYLIETESDKSFRFKYKSIYRRRKKSFLKIWYVIHTLILFNFGRELKRRKTRREQGASVSERRRAVLLPPMFYSFFASGASAASAPQARCSTFIDFQSFFVQRRAAGAPYCHPSHSFQSNAHIRRWIQTYLNKASGKYHVRPGHSRIKTIG